MKKQQYIMTIITVIFLIGVGIYGHKTKHVGETDTTAIAEETAVLHTADKTFSNSFEADITVGAKTTIQSKFRGSIIKVLVKNKQFVKKGQLLFEIERESSTSRLEKATNRIDELEEELKLVNERVEKGDFVDDAQRVNFNSRRDILTQAITLAKQALDSVELQNEALLEDVYAPYDGVVDMISVALGGEVAKGHILTYILPYTLTAKLNRDEMESFKPTKTSYISKQLSIKYGGSTYQVKDADLASKIEVMESEDTESISIPIPTSLEGFYLKEEKVEGIITLVYKEVVEVPIQAIVEQDNQKYVWVKDKEGDYEKLKVSVIRKVNENYLVHGKLDDKAILLTPAVLDKK